MKKLDYITVLRAIAILGVLAVHSAPLNSGTKFVHPYILSIWNNGARGVQLFYLLSAFTLFHSFSRRSEKEINPTRNYFIRRFFRIAPLYYLAIIYYLWEDGTGPRFWLGDCKGISNGNIVSNFLFLHGFNPYWFNSLVFGGWSVGIEMVFYCFLPFLFSRIKNIQHACNFVFITLLIRLVFFRFLNSHQLISSTELWHQYLYYYLPNQLPVFALGIVLYFVIYGEKPLVISGKSLFLYGIIFILGINPPLDDIHYYAIFFMLIVLGLRKYHPVVLFNKVFLHIGKISYSLYLTQFAAIHVITWFKLNILIKQHNEATGLLGFALNYLLLVGISLILATITYYAVEAPMQKVGGMLIKRVSRNSTNLKPQQV